VLLARAYRSLPRPLSVLEPSHPLASVTLPNDYFSIIIGNHFAVFALTYATTACSVDTRPIFALKELDRTSNEVPLLVLLSKNNQ
jgi:hypothetical protein